MTVDCARWSETPGAQREAGLYATVATGSWNELPVLSTLVAEAQPVADFSIAQKDACAVEFEGFIQIKKDGAYTFSVDGNGPRSLRIATARVVKDANAGAVTLKSGTYPIELTFVAAGGAAPSVFIEGPELTKQKIPAELLSRDAKQRPVSGISVSTSMQSHKYYKPELAVDGRPGTFFWTSRGLNADDHFTLTFAKPLALNNVEIITGKPEGGDSLEKGVLEISEDGAAFSEAAKFNYGNAAAALNGKNVKALRIRSTKGQGGWLAIREIYLNAKAPALSGKPTAAINLDFSDTPDLKDWALRAQKDADAEYASICERLNSDGFTAPRQIMFIFKKDKGIAWTIGTTITYAEGWIKADPRDTGTVIHELTHVIQSTPEQKRKFSALTPDSVKESGLAGEPITAKLTLAPANQAPIGGLKVVTKNGWFAARPSGTENIYKIYAESFQSASHLHEILGEAEQIVNNALGYGDLGSGSQR